MNGKEGVKKRRREKERERERERKENVPHITDIFRLLSIQNTCILLLPSSPSLEFIPVAKLCSTALHVLLVPTLAPAPLTPSLSTLTQTLLGHGRVESASLRWEGT